MERKSSLEEFCHEGEQRNGVVGGNSGLQTQQLKKQTCGDERMEREIFMIQKERRDNSSRKVSEWVKAGSP